MSLMSCLHFMCQMWYQGGTCDSEAMRWWDILLREMWGLSSQRSTSDWSVRLIGYTKEFKEFMAFIGDGASELSWPSAVSLLALFPLYWPINEPSSLNCPSSPSPYSTKLSSLSSLLTVPLDGVLLPFNGLWSSLSLKEKITCRC